MLMCKTMVFIRRRYLDILKALKQTRWTLACTRNRSIRLRFLTCSAILASSENFMAKTPTNAWKQSLSLKPRISIFGFICPTHIGKICQPKEDSSCCQPEGSQWQMGVAQTSKQTRHVLLAKCCISDRSWTQQTAKYQDISPGSNQGRHVASYNWIVERNQRWATILSR